MLQYKKEYAHRWNIIKFYAADGRWNDTNVFMCSHLLLRLNQHCAIYLFHLIVPWVKEFMTKKTFMWLTYFIFYLIRKVLKYVEIREMRIHISMFKIRFNYVLTVIYSIIVNKNIKIWKFSIILCCLW